MSVLPRLKDFEPRRAVYCWQIVDLVCKEFDIEKGDLRGKRGNVAYFRPRQIAAYVMWTFGKSLQTSGRALNRDHATIVHSIRRVDERMKADPEFFQLVRGLVDLVQDGKSLRGTPKNPAPPPPPRNPKTQSSLPLETHFEIWKLRDKGWSLTGICRRFQLSARVVAPLIGVRIEHHP